MSPPHRQSLARISEELCIHVATLQTMEEAMWLVDEPAKRELPKLTAVE